MSRLVILGNLLLALGMAGTLQAATLRQLSMTDMVSVSTAIVRARVTGSSASFTGSTIYTHYKLQVTESLKGSATEVDLPGGVAGGLRQSFPGVPLLQTGTEYVLFLWTSSKGITHIVGLSQGLFSVAPQADGSVQVARPRIGETMHNASGQVVQDEPVQTTLASLRQLVSQSATQ